MGLSPNPMFPERSSNVYAMKMSGNEDRRGPPRFEEGIANDTHVPMDLPKGMSSGSAVSSARPNLNAPD